MKRHLISGVAGVIAACSLQLCGTANAAVDEPDCASLQRWAGSLSQDSTFEPRAGITLNALFDDEHVVPLFGAPLVAWAAADVSSLQGWLAGCRKQAMAAGNRDAGDALYAALKELKRASRSLRKIWNAQRVVERQVTNLLGLQASPALPEILAIAQAALRGEEVNDRVSALSRQWQGYGRQAAQLKAHSGMLSAEEVEQWIARLDARRGDAGAAVAQRSEAHAELLAEIAAVSLSQQGLAQLNRIAYRADPGAMTREEQDSYNRAFQAKRQQIQRQAAAQQAQVARDMATLPAPAREQVNAVLLGDSAADASIRGLRPGASYAQIKSAAARLWGYVEAISLSLEEKLLTTKRREFDRLMRMERRDGGLLKLRTRKGMVGELAYIEHFPGPVAVDPLRTDLQARFGTPDGEEQLGDGELSLMWRDGDGYLRVRASNRVIPERNQMGARSSVEITLWTQAFADYLAEAAERCEKLRNKPASDLSINDKQAIFMSCLTP